MKYIDEFRNKKLVKEASGKIAAIAPKRKINFMEVCGTHTQNFFRFGLNKILPANLRLIAGPGCPVCVSSQGYIDNAIALAGDKENIILTFGDMLRIPGSNSSLERARARFGNVRVVYSPLDALAMAGAHPDKKCIFLAVGFETTAPTIALTIATASKMKLKNLFFLSALKLIPAVMDYL
ncbi:MAG: hydrogenase formation protein HypD, partial [Candidatus Omnitrophota bacterium]|nr:hydrogenase formation protein HypD [Candidatus Omnitrophota bacterium]